MPKIDEAVTTVTPRWLIAATLIALIARFVLIAADCQLNQSATNLVAWKNPSPINKSTAPGGKPLLYFFTADWCGSCRTIDRKCFHNRQIASEINNSFIPIKVVDKSLENGINPSLVQELEDEFHVLAFPDVIVTLPDGTFVYRTHGAKNDDFQRFLQNSTKHTLYVSGRIYLGKGDYANADHNYGDYINKYGWKNELACYCVLRRYVALRFLHREAEADQLLKVALEKLDTDKWPYVLVEYLAGKVDYPAAELKSGDGLTHRVHLHTYAGLYNYFNGNQHQTLSNLIWVVKQKEYQDWVEYKLAQQVVKMFKGKTISVTNSSDATATQQNATDTTHDTTTQPLKGTSGRFH